MDSPKLIDQYKFVREEIKQEYTLMTARKNWLMIPQTFLFTALVLGMGENQPFKLINSVYYPLIPIIGILLLIIPQLGICGTLRKIKSWKNKQRLIERDIKKLCSNEKNYYLQDNQPISYFLAIANYILITPIFLFAWLYILEFNLYYAVCLSIICIFATLILANTFEKECD
ncbi:MAG: hypothetical protein KI793_01930 [Rivularia sp. (in: Bacteria)]|nr:hypothetical protein [Rivularia sp. MS3]